jgi:hypothetical protein
MTVCSLSVQTNSVEHPDRTSHADHSASFVFGGWLPSRLVRSTVVLRHEERSTPGDRRLDSEFVTVP